MLTISVNADRVPFNGMMNHTRRYVIGLFFKEFNKMQKNNAYALIILAMFIIPNLATSQRDVDSGVQLITECFIPRSGSTAYRLRRREGMRELGSTRP